MLMVNRLPHSGTLAHVAVDMAGAQPAREHVDGARCVHRPQGQHVDEQQLSFGNGMHRNVAIVVQERCGQPARLAIDEHRDAADVHPRRARGRDDQAADERAVGQLIRGHADKVGDDVLKGS